MSIESFVVARLLPEDIKKGRLIPVRKIQRETRCYVRAIALAKEKRSNITSKDSILNAWEGVGTSSSIAKIYITRPKKMRQGRINDPKNTVNGN